VAFLLPMTLARPATEVRRRQGKYLQSENRQSLLRATFVSRGRLGAIFGISLVARRGLL